MYGFAASSVIYYCKAILATLIRDAVGDSSSVLSWGNHIHLIIDRQTKKQAMRTLVIRIEQMEVWILT